MPEKGSSDMEGLPLTTLQANAEQKKRAPSISGLGTVRYENLTRVARQISATRKSQH